MRWEGTTWQVTGRAQAAVVLINTWLHRGGAASPGLLKHCGLVNTTDVHSLHPHTQKKKKMAHQFSHLSIVFGDDGEFGGDQCFKRGRGPPAQHSLPRGGLAYTRWLVKVS